jgi:hypothetical protein
MLNDRVLSFFEEHDARLLRALKGRGSEYGGNRESQEYQLSLAVEEIEHSGTKAESPQSTASASASTERYRRNSTARRFAKKLYRGLDELQCDLDEWIGEYNQQRTHSAKSEDAAADLFGFERAGSRQDARSDEHEFFGRRQSQYRLRRRLRRDAQHRRLNLHCQMKSYSEQIIIATSQLLTARI